MEPQRDHEPAPADAPVDALAAKLADRSAKVGILGLGYVGLPLALEVARAGFPVTGFDPASEKVRALGEGRSYVEDVTDAEVREVFSRADCRASDRFEGLADQDVIIVCVPTPLSKTKEPDMRYVESSTREIAKTLRRGQLVVMESTTYPGTTEELVLPKMAETGLTPDEDFFLAFSPERVDPKNSTYGVKNTPKVVGGQGPNSNRVVVALYSAFVDTVVPVSTPKTAEMVKLLENTFRAVNIGLINEIAIMCNKLGVDVWEVIDAAKTKPFGFMPFYPGPGLGGHCIPVDPLYLGWKLRTLNYRARFVELADHVNSTMPNYVVFRAAATLNDDTKCVRGSRVLLLGMAYKPGVSDVRESPSLGILQQLVGLGAEVDYHDPYVPELPYPDRKFVSVDLTPEAVAGYDLIVVATHHAEVDYAMVAAKAQKVLDTRNAFAALGDLPNVVRL